MTTPTDRLDELGLELPSAPAPAADYRPWARVGGLVFTAGQLPLVDGALPATGRVGGELTTARGAELARAAALNVLAVAAHALGGLDAVRVVKLTVFVASEPWFAEQHLVADGASGLIAEILGDAGQHARSAVGVGDLPKNSPVEVEAVVTTA